MIEKEIVDNYSKRGWVIHPLSSPKDGESSPGKRPLIVGWTTIKETPSDIEKYLKKGCNIGLVCGKASNLEIIDFDSELFIPDLMNGCEFKTLGSYRTVGRGHLYFKYNPSVPASKHHDLGIEILSDGSNVVLPTSIHKTGDVYKWKDPEVQVIEMPLKFIDNLNTLFEREAKLKTIILKCRPCFRKYWADETRVSHGSTARVFLGAFCSELFNNGADLEIIKMFAKIIYQKDYNERTTVNEFNGWTSKNIKPFSCETIKLQCVGFTHCDSCPVGKKTQDIQDKNTQFNCVEMELKDILSLHEIEAERKCIIDLPQDHFLSEYTKWMSSISDGYIDYQNLCGLWLLSTLTNNRVKLRLKQEIVKPNLWIFNIGKSTTSRKSTIVNKTRKIFEVATDSTLYNEDYSIEGYLETLAQHPILFNVRDEAAGLMAKYHKKYNEGILELECAIYDGQNFKKTLAGGKSKEPRVFEVINPFVTKLYATTPDNFARYMTIDDFTCGYGFRFLFASPNHKKERKGLEMETEEDIEAWGRVLSKVKMLNTFFNKLGGNIDFKIAPEAMEYYNKIILNLENKADEMNNDILNSAIGRSQIHILKIAMLFEIGKKDISFEVKLDSIKIASELVIGYFLPSLMDLIDRLQEDVKFNQIEKITSVLRKLGGVASHSKVLHDCKVKGKDFAECIDTMVDSNTVKVIRDKNTKIVYYRLLNSSPILSIPRIPPVRAYEESIGTRENLENLNKLEMLPIHARACAPITSGVLGSNYIGELGEFWELREFEGTLRKANQKDISEFITKNYNKLNKPESLDDMRRLKNSIATAVLLEFDTDEPSVYAEDYCHARGWE